MLIWEARMNILDLRRQGHSIRTIARLSGHSRNTVRRILAQGAKVPKKRGRRSKLEPFKDYLQTRYLETGLSGTRLFQEIQTMGYEGAIDTVQRFLQKLNEPQKAFAKATVRFETPPGEQAQVDWAEVGYYLDEHKEKRKVYAFVMILSFSRMIYVEFTTRMHLPELIECHKRAFAYFGGFPRRILYDNMKQVRLSPTEWNPLMQDFLQHYAVVPQTCRPHRPRTKGKVERAIRYLKDSFIKGGEFLDLADLRAKGQHWQNEIANRRIHATTHKRPVDLLKAENLTSYSGTLEYRLSERFERTVDAEGFVRLSGSRYSVPPSVVGQRVIVEQGEQKIIVRLGEAIVAEHKPALRAGECVTKPEHVAQMWQLAMARTPVLSKKGGKLLFEQAVEARPLSVYEEAAR